MVYKLKPIERKAGHYRTEFEKIFKQEDLKAEQKAVEEEIKNNRKRTEAEKQAEAEKQLQNGAYALLDTLVQNGTRYIFGYPGGAILPIYDELYFWEQQKLVTHILTRHEQGAIHAADAYARVTGQVGVCFATSGPGATNLITGIANAHIDSVPLIVITGQVGRSFLGTDAFQETDIFGITLPIVKHSYKVLDPNDLCRIVSEAFYLAQNGRPGPILIDIPKDVGSEKLPDYFPITQKEMLDFHGYRFQYHTSKDSIMEILEVMKLANRPLLYIGGGAVTANAHKELFELSDTYSLPVTTTLMGKGVITERYKYSVGMLGMHGTAYANFAISECDLLVAIGARFDDRVTGKLDAFACAATIIQIDIDPAEIGKNKIVDLSIVGDIKQIFYEIFKESRKETEEYKISTKRKSWLRGVQKWKRTYPLIVPRIIDKLSPQYVINTIGNQYLHAVFTTDVGQHQMWSAQFLHCGPRRWASSAGLGTMGYGLPAAIGAQIAYPTHPVICITGDSSIQMCIQELGTVAQYNLPIRIMIMNNHWQGMVRQWQESFYENRYSHSSMDQGQPDFVALANSYGIKGVNVENETQLHAALYEYRYYPYPILFDILITENENCYPMVSPGKTNAVMQGVHYQQAELEMVERLTNNEVRLELELEQDPETETKASADENVKMDTNSNADSPEEKTKKL